MLCWGESRRRIWVFEIPVLLCAVICCASAKGSGSGQLSVQAVCQSKQTVKSCPQQDQNAKTRIIHGCRNKGDTNIVIETGERAVHDGSGAPSLPVAPSRSSSWPKWEEPIVKGLAESGPTLVALAFAAFTFLYGTLIVVQGDNPRTKELKKKLRKALYGTAAAVLSATFLTVVAFLSIGLESRVLAFIAMSLGLLIATIICGITVGLGLDVFREGD